MNKFNINPCKSCLDKYNKGYCDINNINQCCYDTLAAFKNTNNINEIRNSPEAKNCIQCITDYMKSIGRDKSNFQLDPPPIWNNVPHYFPNLLYQQGDIKKAHNMCITECNKNIYPNQCKENCNTDANAVETFSHIPKKNNIKFNSDVAKTNPIPFYIGFVLFAIIFSIIIILFFKSLYMKI